MPVEIKELLIRINVSEQASPTSQAAQSPTDQIIAESVEQVMDLLKKQKER